MRGGIDALLWFHFGNLIYKVKIRQKCDQKYTEHLVSYYTLVGLSQNTLYSLIYNCIVVVDAFFKCRDDTNRVIPLATFDMPITAEKKKHGSIDLLVLLLLYNWLPCLADNHSFLICHRNRAFLILKM